MSRFEDVFRLAHKPEKQTGSDYIAVVTRVKDGVAYVQITGSEINDTPAAMSISAEPGDTVRVRISNGKAWITGNDTRPPNNDSGKISEISEENREIAKKLTSLQKNLNKYAIDANDSGRTGTYAGLEDKPSIEGVTLVGDKTFEDLTLCGITNSELETMLTLD